MRSVFGFIRLATNPRVFEQPLSIDQALSRVEQWFQQSPVRFVVPGPRYLQLAFGLLRTLGLAGNLTTDVQLAALAIENPPQVVVDGSVKKRVWSRVCGNSIPRYFL